LSGRQGGRAEALRADRLGRLARRRCIALAVAPPPGSERTSSMPPTKASGTVVAVAPAADRADSAATEGGGDGPHTTSAMPSRCGIGSGCDERALSPARAWRASQVAATAPGVDDHPSGTISLTTGAARALAEGFAARSAAP
jgi:hypothetical protein